MKANIEIVSGRFGSSKIYGATQQPTHAVVAKRNWLAYGDSAVAISHHWDEQSALSHARAEQHDRKEEILVVAFQDRAVVE